MKGMYDLVVYYIIQEKMRIKINRNIVTAFLFSSIIFFLTLFNFKGLKNIFRENLNQLSLDSSQKVGTTIEDSYRTTFKTRDKFIVVYGMAQLALNKNMIGNFEFLKDEQGFMHMFGSNQDASQFNCELVRLNNLLKEMDTPLLYVQIPSRQLEGFTKFSTNIIEGTNQTIHSILKNLHENDIKYLDIRNNLINNEYPEEEVFLKTDVHLKTDTEFWILQKMVETLESGFGLNFQNKIQVLDKSNYSIVNKKLLGNLGRSSGKYFTGLDDFELYYPNFETNLELTNYISGEIRAGEFWNTVMNGIDSDDYNTYWVTNYLQWPSPFYNIENKNVGDNNILIIMDSMGLRTASYLSLLCNNVTILDSRYFNGVNYLEKALGEKNYDAVIVLQSTNLVGSSLFPKELQAEIVYDSTPTNIERGKKYNISITVKNISEEIWNEDKLIRLCIWQDGIDHGYRIKIPDGVEIKPGEEYTFVLNDFQAPPSDSTYLEFQMLQEGRIYFGEKERVDITVK